MAKRLQGRDRRKRALLLGGFTPVEVPAPEHDEETHGHASVIASFVEAIKTGKRPGNGKFR